MKKVEITKREIIWIKALAVTIILFIAIYLCFFKQYTSIRYIGNERMDNITKIEMTSGDSVAQQLSFESDRLHNIGFYLLNKTADCEGILDFALADQNGNVLWNAQLNIKEMDLCKTNWTSVNIDIDTDNQYVILISATKLHGKIMLAGVEDAEKIDAIIDNVYYNGERQEKQSLYLSFAFAEKLTNIQKIIIMSWCVIISIYILGFHYIFAQKERWVTAIWTTVMYGICCIFRYSGILQFRKDYNFWLFGIVIKIIFFSIIIHAILLMKKKTNVVTFFVVSTLLFGTLYSIVLPPFMAPDENIHFAISYRLSNAMMGLPINDENNMIIMRECDVKDYQTKIKNGDLKQYYKNIIEPDNESKKLISTERDENIRAPIIQFIPQAIGITIGRLIQTRYIYLLYWGRIMNLLFFTVITALAIKIIPYGKWTIYCISQIPIALELVSSYSYDTLILACSFLLISYILKLKAQNENIKPHSLLLLTVLSLIFSVMKPVYLPIISLILVIPNSKMGMKKVNSYIFKIGIIFLAIIISYSVYSKCLFSMNRVQQKFNITNSVDNDLAVESKYELLDRYTLNDDEIDIEYQDSYTKLSKEFLINNIFSPLKTLTGTIILNLDEYFMSLFGNYLGWYDIQLPSYLSFIIFFLFCFSLQFGNERLTMPVTHYEKKWIVCVICGCIFAVYLVAYLSWTNPSSCAVSGIQGRYFLPVLPAFILLFSNKKIIKTKMSLIIVPLTSFVHIMTIFICCYYIWKR